MNKSFYKKLTGRKHAVVIKTPEGCLEIVKAEVEEIINHLYFAGKSVPVIETAKNSLTVSGLDWRTVFELPMRLHTPCEISLLLHQKTVKFEKQLDEFFESSRLKEHLLEGSAISVKSNCVSSRIYHEGMVKERLSAFLEKHCDIKPQECGYQLRLDIDNNRASLTIGLCHDGFWKQKLKANHTSLAPFREDFAASFISKSLQNGQKKFNADTFQTLTPFGGSGTFFFLTALQLSGQNHFMLHPDDFFSCLRYKESNTISFISKKIAENQTKTHQFMYVDLSEKEACGFQENLKEFSQMLPLDAKVLQGDVFQLEAIEPESFAEPVFIPMNPPWGERLSEKKVARALYKKLPAFLNRFQNAFGFVLITQTDILRHTEKTLSSLGFEVEVTPHNYFGMNLKCLYFLKKTK